MTIYGLSGAKERLKNLKNARANDKGEYEISDGWGSETLTYSQLQSEICEVEEIIRDLERDEKRFGF